MQKKQKCQEKKTRKGPHNSYSTGCCIDLTKKTSQLRSGTPTWERRNTEIQLLGGSTPGCSFGQLMVRLGGLGPGGLDSDWIPENERDCYERGIPIRIPNHRAPNHQLTISWFGTTIKHSSERNPLWMATPLTFQQRQMGKKLYPRKSSSCSSHFGKKKNETWLET